MRSRLSKLTLVLLAAAVPAGSPARAHESQPGLLSVVELGDAEYRVSWRAPTYYGRPHPARLELPQDWRVVARLPVRVLSDARLEQWIVESTDGSLDGDRLRFPGLEATTTDVFVRVSRLDGTEATALVRPARPYVELRGARPWHRAAVAYVGLGFQHILMGADHLLFVLGLLVIVDSRRKLIATVTSFTVAHSLTLAVATLGWARAPTEPLNAAIALSILFLGPEIVRVWRGETSFTIRRPWVVAFLFGLLHGFGFASGLSTAGLPRGEIPLALLSFNIGVELGQIAFVLLVFAAARALRELRFGRPRWAELVPAYLVGSLGAFWVIDRVWVMLVG